MKKEKMVLVLTFIVVVGLGIFITQAKAEEEKWKVISYQSNLQTLPVPAPEKHKFEVIERRGVAIFENGEVATWMAGSVLDLVEKKGSIVRYEQYTFEDSSEIYAKGQFTFSEGPGKLGFIEGKGEFTFGIGRFKGIQGNFACKGSLITPYTPDKTKGDLILECVGDRIMPGK